MSGFSFDMQIDDEGIILVTMTGIFDFDAWAAERRKILKTRLAGVKLVGRPTLVDVTASHPPPHGWEKTFAKVQMELAKVGEGTGPTAFVLQGDPGKEGSVRFFQTIGELERGFAPAMKICRSTEEARRWLLENDSWRAAIET